MGSWSKEELQDVVRATLQVFQSDDESIRAARRAGERARDRIIELQYTGEQVKGWGEDGWQTLCENEANPIFSQKITSVLRTAGRAPPAEPALSLAESVLKQVRI